MPIEDVFTISGRGTVVTGRVERGVLKHGEEVEIVGLREEPLKTVATSIEMFMVIPLSFSSGALSISSYFIHLALPHHQSFLPYL